MKRINSRQKGARGERLAVALFRRHGFMARRGQQFRGGPDSPDVIVEGLPGYHFEVKVGYPSGAKPHEWLEQAAGEAPPGSVPVVLYKAPRQPWRACVRGGIGLDIMSAVIRLEALSGEAVKRTTLAAAVLRSEVVVICSTEGWVEFDADELLAELART